MAILSCKHEPNSKFETPKKYLFFSHVYDSDSTMDRRITKKNLASFDQIWLGGDICANTTFSSTTLQNIDTILDLKSENTHWALGNHDIYRGEEFISNYTGKKPFYANYINGITLVVLNTNYNVNGDCEKIIKQTNFLSHICDTIQSSSHLIILQHHVTWGNIEGIQNPIEFANSNNTNKVFYCEPYQKFDEMIYPKLISVKNKGIQPICLAGDMGQKQSNFEFTSKEGIIFLANGSLSNHPYNQMFPKFNDKDSVLIFFHNIDKRELNWEFVDVGR